jgi:hypothetical protein
VIIIKGRVDPPGYVSGVLCVWSAVPWSLLEISAVLEDVTQTSVANNPEFKTFGTVMGTALAALFSL